MNHRPDARAIDQVFGDPGPRPAAVDAVMLSLPDPSAEPRLGILHLLVGTACVAVWFAVQRYTVLRTPPPGNGNLMPALHLTGIPAGLSLVSLVLWAVRPSRRRPFPKHPGERVWIAFGVLSLSVLVAESLLIVGEALGLLGTIVLLPIVMAGLYSNFQAGHAQTRAPHWRFFFATASYACLTPLVAVAAVVALATLPPVGILVFILAGWIVAALLIGSALAFALSILQDWEEDAPYPWTHWMPGLIGLLAVALWFVGLLLPAKWFAP